MSSPLYAFGEDLCKSLIVSTFEHAREASTWHCPVCDVTSYAWRATVSWQPPDAMPEKVTRETLRAMGAKVLVTCKSCTFQRELDLADLLDDDVLSRITT